MPKKYFARANTSSGCVSLIDNNLRGIENICVAAGRSKAVKTKLLRYVGDFFEQNAEEVEYVYSPFDIRSLDAVILRGRKFAAVCDECCADGRKTINTDDFLNIELSGVSREYLTFLEERAAAEYAALNNEYCKAKAIHDEWEKIYTDNMDFDRLSAFSAKIIDELIAGTSSMRANDRYERFFGASTMNGSVNYIDNLTDGLNRRYFIKGRPGTGKSTFLKKAAKAAQTAGYGVEVYYCSFDKNSLDMVVVPELSFCIFDSTAPHEMFPASERDIILDFYKEAGLTGIDEKYKKQLDLVQHRYNFRIFEGVSDLRKGNGYDIEREYYLERAADFEEIARAADKLIRSIMQ